jgi:hypothetical protein
MGLRRAYYIWDLQLFKGSTLLPYGETEDVDPAQALIVRGLSMPGDPLSWQITRTTPPPPAVIAAGNVVPVPAGSGNAWEVSIPAGTLSPGAGYEFKIQNMNKAAAGTDFTTQP